jgi:hypothetical protein
MDYPPSALAASPVPPSTTVCAAGGGWSNARVIADHITNRSGGQSRPVFSFDATGLPNIRQVRVDLYVDLSSADSAEEQRVSTGVNLRNQDRAPSISDFTYSTPEPGLVVLNASLATDPDNDPLAYCWFDKAKPATTSVGSCIGNATIGGAIADVPVFRYRTTSGTHWITLTVTDPSDLPATFTKQVTVQ